MKHWLIFTLICILIINSCSLIPLGFIQGGFIVGLLGILFLIFIIYVGIWYFNNRLGKCPICKKDGISRKSIKCPYCQSTIR